MGSEMCIRDRGGASAAFASGASTSAGAARAERGSTVAVSTASVLRTAVRRAMGAAFVATSSSLGAEARVGTARRARRAPWTEPRGATRGGASARRAAEEAMSVAGVGVTRRDLWQGAALFLRLVRAKSSGR